MLGQLLLRFYMNVLDMSPSDALINGIGNGHADFVFVDGPGSLRQNCPKMRSGTVCSHLRHFANSLTSSALEGKSEGWIHGIGTGMFKLAGSVLTYGIVSAVIFASLRYIFFGDLYENMGISGCLYQCFCSLCGSAGRKGPYGERFDYVSKDLYDGEDSFEKAEISL